MRLTFARRLVATLQCRPRPHAYCPLQPVPQDTGSRDWRDKSVSHLKVERSPYVTHGYFAQLSGHGARLESTKIRWRPTP